MKNLEKKTLSLQKLSIARIDRTAQININGGDCLPTEPTWQEHVNSDFVCPTSQIP